MRIQLSSRICQEAFEVERPITKQAAGLVILRFLQSPFSVAGPQGYFLKAEEAKALGQALIAAAEGKSEEAA